jgi:two-component system sensor histidine kinase UhpB
MGSYALFRAPEELQGLLRGVVCEAFWEREVGSEVVHWSGNLDSLFGYRRAEVRGHSAWWYERVHPDDAKAAVQGSRDAVDSGATSFACEYRFRRKDGAWAWVASRAAIIRDDQGEAVRIMGAMIDVTRMKDAESALTQNRELFSTVLSTLPVGAVVLDETGNVTFANEASNRIWGRVIVDGSERWQRSVGYRHPSAERIRPEDWASSRALRDGLTTLNEIIEIETFAGERKIVESSVAPIRDSESTIVGAIVVNEDVTERVRGEEALRKTQRLLLDAERLGKTGSWEMDLDSGQIYNSDASRRLFFGDDMTKGGRLEDYADVIHPEDAERVSQSRAAMLEGTGPCDIEYRVIWPDGSTHVIFARATVERDETGRARRIYGTNADITERKHAEQELARRARQLEFLSRKLIQTQESERRDLSNELHDDLGQMLFAIKLNLDRQSPKDPESLRLIDGAIARMRDLVHSLRPPLLDDAGLEASLRHHVEREAGRAGLASRLELGPLETRPSSSVEITCFRIAQEALSNIMRHAQARTVDVELDTRDGFLRLTVRDDGHGFDVAVARARATSGASQGLLSMQERAALVGGDLEIDSAAGRGTTVRVRLPLQPSKATRR